MSSVIEDTLRSTNVLLDSSLLSFDSLNSRYITYPMGIESLSALNNALYFSVLSNEIHGYRDGVYTVQTWDLLSVYTDVLASAIAPCVAKSADKKCGATLVDARRAQKTIELNTYASPLLGSFVYTGLDDLSAVVFTPVALNSSDATHYVQGIALSVCEELDAVSCNFPYTIDLKHFSFSYAVMTVYRPWFDLRWFKHVSREACSSAPCGAVVSKIIVLKDIHYDMRLKPLGDSRLYSPITLRSSPMKDKTLLLKGVIYMLVQPWMVYAGESKTLQKAGAYYGS